MIAPLVYLLCAVTSALCAAMLLLQHRRQPVRLLLWSGLCFVGLALNNILLFVDLVLFTDGPDLSAVRGIPAVLGLITLLWGFIWDSA